jgi:hypothetical protein
VPSQDSAGRSEPPTAGSRAEKYEAAVKLDRAAMKIRDEYRSHAHPRKRELRVWLRRVRKSLEELDG